MTQPDKIKMESLGETVGTVPTLLGYTPGEGDVTVLVSNSEGRVVLTANVPDESWIDEEEDCVRTARYLDQVLSGIDTDALLVMGHGFQAEHRAAALVDAMAETTSRHTLLCGVRGNQFREIRQGVEGEWVDQRPPNPALAVNGGLAEPAANRDAAFARYNIIETDVPENEFVDEAREFVKTLPNNAGKHADEAMTMLRSVDTSEDCRWAVAVVGELVSHSKNVRDACLAELLVEDPPDLEKLTYVARSSNDQHRAALSSVAAVCYYFDGKPAAVGTFGERAQETNLGRLALEAHNLGMPPSPEFKETLRAGGQESRNLAANPGQSTAPVVTPERSKGPSTSVDGVDPMSGPTAGPGVGGVGI